MRKLLWLISGVTLIALAGGCGKKNSTMGVTFDTSVPSDQQAHLQNDLARLSQMSLASTQDLDIVDISDYSSSSMQSWINSRIKYIVGQDYNSSANEGVVASGVPYNPTVMSTRQSSLNDSGQVYVIMSNLGGQVFLDGQKSSTLFSLNVGGDNLTVNTPRIGVVQIGEGLFTADALSSSSLDASVNSYLRLATLFHEARHSDGNGSSVCIAHAKCPSGKYAGNYACEMALNGPYNVGRVMLTRFYEVCTDCNDTELQALASVIDDYQSRTLPGAQWVDDRPETISQ